VLGGVSPTPYRATAAEESIINKPITEEIAERAAKAAVCETTPLAMNAYKIPVTEALVKRALRD